MINKMRWLVVLFALSFLVQPNIAKAQDSGKSLLTTMAETVKKSNFEASFVVVKGRSIEPYLWRHAKVDGTELEHLSLLNGAGVEMVRINDVVTYFEPQSQPYSLHNDSVSGPIPSILFKNVSALEPHYHFVLGGKSRISGRSAQLVRIEAKDQLKFNYWLWLDSESSLPLKAAYVRENGEVVEQLQLTNVNFTKHAAKELVEMSQQQFPAPLPQNNTGSEVGDWQITWLPAGFKLIKSHRQTLNLNNELADHYLYSDGLVEFSVFIQRPLAGKMPSKALSSGATTVFIRQADGFEVSVVGKIPPMTAKQISDSVYRAH